jgi:hypothetical protein
VVREEDDYIRKLPELEDEKGRKKEGVKMKTGGRIG